MLSHSFIVIAMKQKIENKKVDDTINPLKDNSNIPGFVWISGKTRREMDEIYKKVINTIRIEYE